MSVRVKEIPKYLELISKKYGSAVRSGRIFILSTSDDEYAQISINSAAFILLKDVVADSDTFKLHRIEGVDAGEVLVDKMGPYGILAPGQIWRLTELSSSGTDTVGVVSAATSVRTQLGVNANGKLCVKQSAGEGSTAIAMLLENDIASDGSIRVMITNVTG